jgi:hypothetical protein
LSLDAAARRRYARQVVLAEIREAGQDRLLVARFSIEAASDGAASAVAADYLVRAGCAPSEDGETLRVPDESVVANLAGAAALRPPAAALVGALSAVEHIKAVLGVGTPGKLDPDLQLATKA